VIRNRIDEFGVAEPVVQRSGENRIIVELPGIEDAERAAAVVQQAAFLQFQITDKTQALEKAIPRLDQIARDQNLVAAAGQAGGAAPAPAGGLDIFQSRGDSAGAAADSS